MKDWYEMPMTDGESSQKFTIKEVLLYGVIVPAMLVIVLGVAGWIERM